MNTLRDLWNSSVTVADILIVLGSWCACLAAYHRGKRRGENAAREWLDSDDGRSALERVMLKHYVLIVERTEGEGTDAQVYRADQRAQFTHDVLNIRLRILQHEKRAES